MNINSKTDCNDLTSFDRFSSSSHISGMSDWAVPWADLMMVMFVLFVVLFIYSSTHKDVRVLFSEQSAAEARDTSTLDPLIGLIGQISSQASGSAVTSRFGSSGKEVLFRSLKDGVTIVQDGEGRVRVTLRGNLFFSRDQAQINDGAEQYLNELGELVRTNSGLVHVVGYSSDDEAEGMEGFALSSARAASVAQLLVDRFGIAPKRIILSGRGSYNPERPGTTLVNMTRNRRVEIIISTSN